MIPFYGNGDELNLAFNIPFVQLPLEATALRAVIERTEELMPEGCTPVWTGSNHDVPRFPTRWAENDPARARCALMMLLTLRGSVFLYEGDEIGMVDTPLEQAQMKDPVSIRYFPVYGRDGARTPMQWSARPGGGLHRTRRRAVAPVRRPVGQRRGPAARPGVVPVARPATSSGCATRCRICGPARTCRWTRPTVSSRTSAASGR